MKSFLIGLAVFLLVAMLTQYLAYQRHTISQEADQRKVLHEINSVKERLRTSLSYSLSATKTLAFIVKEYGVPQDFNRVAREILESNKFIDALELTKGGVITHVYPLEGNESVIGYDVLKDPLRNEEARWAIEKKALFFAGPFELKQGGMAVVGRLPIFTNNKFWGFSAVLIKFSTLLEAAGIDTTQNNEFGYQLSKINPTTHEEEFFLRQDISPEKEQVASIEIDDGEWKLYVVSKDDQQFNTIAFSLLGLVLSFISGLFAWHLARQPERLQHLVEEKTVLLESIINSLPGIFYMYDRTGRFMRWNKNFEVVSGYSGDEIRAMSPLDFFNDKEKKLLKEKIDEVFNSGSAEVTAHFCTKDKRKIPCFFNGRKATFDNIDYLIGMGIDITERVLAEQELLQRTEEIEELTIHLERIREEERTRISREIHDELGQQLTGLKMDASWIGKKVTSDTTVYERLSSMISLIDETIKTVKRISSELRPGILDDLGLIPTLEWQTAEFEKRTGIKSRFVTTITDFYPERNLSTNIFRVYQEALTNIARHANATEVETTLDQSNDHLRLVVKDNGKGFDINQVVTNNSLGLIGMKERARMFQGELIIEKNHPTGTIVILNTPCQSNSILQ